MSDPKDYTVGWICAISTEYVAAQAFLDEKHAVPDYVSPNDNNDYTLGKIGKHNVVIAVLPNGEYGISSAASVARDMLHSFSNVRIGLMVGIGGGAPTRKRDIRLGDIVVSNSSGWEGWAAVSGLEAQYESEGHHLEEAINKVLEKKPRLRRKYRRPDPSSDRLYQVDGPSNFILRPERTEEEDNPTIHYGLIASADQLMKDALLRDHLAAEMDVLCFEMEAAGLMNHFPCLVIRGICDYSDSHKNKEWQGYAAMAAASYTKDLLCRMAPNRVEAEKTICGILSSVQSSTEDTNAKVEKLSQRGDDQERQIIADWLTPVDYARQQSDFISRRQEGTGEWLLKSDKFQQWLKQCNQTLFCPGMPGAGKTIITSIVIDHLHNTFRHDPKIGIAYLYFNFRQQHEQKPTDLVLGLFKQLVQEHTSMPESVRYLYIHHKPKRTRPSPDEISRALHSVAASYSRVFIIVDALDEWQVSDEGRKMFLSDVYSLQAKTRVNLFTTSRFIQEIEKHFQGSIRLEIRASDTDVQKYLNAKLQNFRPLVLKDILLQEEIKSRIAKAVDGMFLLAQLYVDSLAYKTTPKAIRKALEDLEIEPEAPNDDKESKALGRAYMQAMERINAQAAELQELAKHVLSWITCSRRPLTSSELQHALAVEIDEPELDTDNIPQIEDMVSVCAGLVIIDENSDIIRLVHYTTQEYFERSWRSWFPNAQSNITRRCLTYLSFTTFESGACQTDGDFIDRLSTHVLYDYASQNWGDHARASFSRAVHLEALDFLGSRNKVAACSQPILLSMRYPGDGHGVARHMGAVHLAAYFGLDGCMEALLAAQQNPSSRDSIGLTPLHWGSQYGHSAVVKLLLERVADKDPVNSHGVTPLYLAALNGHEIVVDLLLQKGADSTRVSGLFGLAPLHRAAQNGHKAVVKLMIENGADPTFCSEDGWTPLHFAAENGHKPTIRLLLQHSVNPRTNLAHHDTPLHWAATEGNETVVKLLIDNGMNPGDKGNYGLAPLHWAAYMGHQAVVRLLLNSGVDREPKGDANETPLQLAAENGHEAVVELILRSKYYQDIEGSDSVSQSSCCD